MITDSQLVFELAANFYINKDRIMDIDQAAGKPEYPDPDRPWQVYRDEWFALSEVEKQVWLDKAQEWLDAWTLKHGEVNLELLKRTGLPVYSIGR